MAVALRRLFLAVALACAVGPAAAIGVGDALDIIKVAKDVVVGLAKAWNLVDEHVDFSEVPLPILDKTERKLFDRIGLIGAKLDVVGQQVDAIGTNTISTVLHNLPERIRLELHLNDLMDYLTRMDVNYRRLQGYTEDRKNIEKLTLENYAETIVSHDSNSAVSLLERIHAFVVPNNKAITGNGLFQLLRKTLETLDEDITFGLEPLDSVWALQLAYGDLRSIYALYESFRRFQREQTTAGRIPSPKKAWTNLAETILHDPKNKAEDALKRVYDVIKQNMFQAALKEVEGDMLCNAKQSPQQVLYNLYNAIALTELKGYTMIQFAYMLLRMYDKGNFSREAELSRQRFEERTNDAVEIIRGVMKNATRELWMCDPKRHIQGETYEEVTQLLQGYVQNEVDLNSEGTCRENCAEYTYTKSHGCYQNQFCQKQRRCNGKIINCRFYDSDMWICPSSLPNRRYEYIEYENGRVLGRKQGCTRGVSKVDSWWRWLFWHCSYCFCMCDEQGSTSDRYFSMKSVIADIDNNRVVTGLRFVKKNRIIHLQIQEGQLLPRGNINVSTVHWVPPQEFKITDNNIFNGQDYHTLTWERRAMDLDDLEADNGYILTGVRFKEIGSHLNFEIYMSKYDFENGRLINPRSTSIWKDNPNTDSSVKNPRKQLRLTNPDIPTRTPSPSIPTSKSDQYVEFTHSDIDRDVAQTTVPFLDAQPLESLQAVPLIGAGIFHKGRSNFGGFITPKIITYDFSKHVKAAFPEPEVN